MPLIIHSIEMNVLNKVNFVTEFILIILFGVLIVFTAAQGKPPDHVEDFESLVSELKRVENVVLFEELLHKIRPKSLSETRKSNLKKIEWQEKLDDFKKNKIDHEDFYKYLNKEFEDLERRFNVVKNIVDASSAAQDIFIRGLFKKLAQNLKDKIEKVKQAEEEDKRKIQEEKDRKAKEAQQNVTSTTASTTTKATAPSQPTPNAVTPASAAQTTPNAVTPASTTQTTPKPPDNATPPASVPQPTPKAPDNATAPASPPQPQQNTTMTTTTTTTTTTTATSVPQATQPVQTTQVPPQEKTEENFFLRLLGWIKKMAEFKFSILRAKLDFLKKKFSSFKK